MGSFVGYCTICNKQFVKYRSYHKVCSDRCRRIKTEKNNYGYKKKIIVAKQCDNCEAEFQTNNKKKHFCSNRCAVAYNKKLRIKADIQTRVCEVCQDEFKSSHNAKKYCSSKCYKEAKRRRESNV